MFNIFKILKLIYASFRFVGDPERLDDVLAIAGTINDKKEIAGAIDYLKGLPSKEEAFRKKPVLGSVDIGSLNTLSAGTLGHAYAEYLIKNGFGPNDIKVQSERAMGGTEEEYVVNYFYETHDLFHVVTGFDTDLAGELGLQAFYAAKGPSIFPIFVLALGFLNTFLFAKEDKARRMDAIARGWRMGVESVNFFGIDWRSHFNRPLSDLRRELFIDTGLIASRAPDFKIPEIHERAV